MERNCIMTPHRNISTLLILMFCAITTVYADTADLFCSQDLVGGDILFVVDDSGSMSSLSGSIRAQTRIQALREGMSAFLNELEAETRVGLMFFTQPERIPGVLEGGAFVANPVALLGDGGHTADIINNIKSNEGEKGSPIVNALFEAYLYASGKDVKFGGNRNGKALDRLSHPNSHTGISNKAGCAFSSADGCADEQLSNGGTYLSPFLNDGSDQLLKIVLLTDGAPSRRADKAAIRQEFGTTGCPDGYGRAYACGPTLAQYINGRDLTDMPGNQQAILYTVGYKPRDLKQQDWLTLMAEATGGQYFRYDDADGLEAALTTIMSDSPTPLPSASVQQFTKPALSLKPGDPSQHDTDVYYTVFAAGGNQPWRGNLKRYGLAGEPRTLVDSRGNPAKDAATGRFQANSKSWWSSADDGEDVTLGGAAERLPASANRSIYTNLTGKKDVNLSETSNWLYSANAAALQPYFGGIPPDETLATIAWARGEGENANFMGAPIHSNPSVVTYDYSDQNNPKKIIFFGTTQGYLHAIDAKTGVEQFAFIPQELLSTLPHQAKGSRQMGDEVIHGLDASPVISVKNAAPMETISKGADEVMLYMGMRQGGKQIYALDVTDYKKPQLKWTISGGIPGDNFEKLGQTWSAPLKTTVQIGDGQGGSAQIKDVLIFGGGYDPALDTPAAGDTIAAGPATRQSSNIGNAIFMVDANDGDLLWMASNSLPAGTPGLTLSDMKYSIPSDLSLVDYNRDGIMDYIVVGDTGGQVWRIDFRANQPLTNMAMGSLLASVADDTPAGNRRFFNEADLSIVNHGGALKLAIGIGSGDKANPLNSEVADRFYMVFSEYPMTSPAAPLPIRSFINRTANTENPGLKSWWLDFPANTGEKVLSSSITLNNTVVFSTFAPNMSNGALTCNNTGSQMVNRLWAVSLFDAGAVVDLDGSNGTERVTPLETNGMLTRPTLIVSEGAVTVLGRTGRIAPTQTIELNRGSPDEPTLFKEMF